MMVERYTYAHEKRTEWCDIRCFISSSTQVFSRCQWWCIRRYDSGLFNPPVVENVCRRNVRSVYEWSASHKGFRDTSMQLFFLNYLFSFVLSFSFKICLNVIYYVLMTNALTILHNHVPRHNIHLKRYIRQLSKWF